VLEGKEEEAPSDSKGAAASAPVKNQEESDAVLAEAKMRLALSLAKQRKCEDAEVCFRELLIHREVTLSYSHPLTMIARGLLLHFLLRKHVGWQEEADDDDKDNDVDHNIRKMSCNTMAAIAEECVKKGDLSGAETMYRRIIQTSEFTLGRDSPTVIIAVERLAQIYFSDEKFEAAEEMFRRVYMSYTHTLGTSHERTLNAQVTYALTLFSNGKLDESEVVYHDALMKFEQTFGADCAETLQVTADFANLLSGERRFADAVFYFKRALKGYEHLLGCDHSVTVSLRAQLLSIENMSIKEYAT
jgi:tetratricopeptide (TPR) repeat protein